MKLSFRNKILLTVAFSCLVCAVSAVFLSARKIKEEGHKSLVSESRSILSRIEVGSRYVAQMNTLDGVIAETVQKFPDGKLTEEQRLKVLKSVPIYAAFEIGGTGAEEEGYTFRIASDNPRLEKNRATPGEQRLLDRFRQQPELKEVVELTPDGKYIAVTRPVRISKERGCLNCHGKPVESPWGNGKDILGYPMEDMKDGDLKGMFSIISSLNSVNETVEASTRDILMFGLLIGALAMVLGYFIVRKPLKDLTQLATHLEETADEVASMSEQIAVASTEISNGATDQASALQQTAASMEQMSAMVSRNSENAERSQGLAQKSQNSATRGQEVVGSMIESIEQINVSNQEVMKQIEESNQKFTEITKVINDIGLKTQVINEIVFQTKLLSFNASVEAARAGEHGKGFAVVAQEVGNLAQMSGNASTEISDMLEESVRKVEAIVQETQSKVSGLMRAGREKVESGTAVARQCGEVLNEIVHGIEDVNQMSIQIAEGSSEQSKGVQEINLAIGQLNTVTQKNAAASQQSSAAADRLSGQAHNLRAAVKSVMFTLHGQEDEKHAA